MKFKILLLFFLISFLLSGFHCKKDKTPEEQLPPETQTGANTFGCLINGHIFKPGGAQLSGGSLQCNYQYLNTGYFFVLIGRYRNNSNGSGESIGIYTDSLKIEEGLKYNLKTRINGNPSGSYSSYTSTSTYQNYETDGITYTGELLINKLDSAKQIVSGTFWFDAVNTNGQRVEVREGRFDVHYTL